MYKSILVPIATDHSPHAKATLEVARKLCSKGGKIVALHVIEPMPNYVAQYLPEGQAEASRKAAEEMLEQETEGAKDIELALVSGAAGRAITEYADNHKMDLIVIASHKPGLQDYFLGSTAARVVRHAQCAVHVIR